MSAQPLYDVVGVGANSIDFVYRLPEYPVPDGPLSKLRISGHERSPGGQIATALSACAALGLRTSYVGTMSSDHNGDFMRDALTSRGVDVAGPWCVPRRIRSPSSSSPSGGPRTGCRAVPDRGSGSCCGTGRRKWS